MRIEILCTGDEVLSGKTVNTNYSHMSRRLQEVGLDVSWGTTVGDSRADLTEAFELAARRADAVIVNGGLGPTVDDLSQEVAAEAAGVELVLNQSWLDNIQSFYTARGREMPPNNRKQAMLPEGAEIIDNPIGTACGFAIDIGNARFFFTPGVPRELRRMLDEQLIPRLQARSGTSTVTALRRFHSFGLGESRVDNMLNGVESLANGGEVKLGFQAHYPQLETKLFARGASADELDDRLAPVERAVREGLGSYLLAEGTQTLEGGLLGRLSEENASLAVAECGTHGAVASRLVAADPEGKVFRRAHLAAEASALGNSVGIAGELTEANSAAAVRVAEAVASTCATTIGLAVLVLPSHGQAEGWVHIGISRSGSPPVQRSACLVGGPERVRAGGVEMGLDCLRRSGLGLSTDDIIDFEKQNARP